jgi:hypothetical protein
VNADTEPQVVPGRPRLTHGRSRTCSVKVAGVGVRQPFMHLDTKEREWQRVHLPAAIRELVLDDQQRRSTICWHVFDD